MNRLDLVELKNRLRAAGAYSKKPLGQHFLIDGAVLQQIVEAAQLQPGDTVVEIGSGPGVLTAELVEKANRLIAFELDPQMVEILREDFPGLELHQGDVLKVAPAVVNTLPSYKVVANIPYQITTPLLKLFLEGGVRQPPSSMTLLIQKEVAERLAAPAKHPERRYLSVVAQYFSEVTVEATVPPTAFWPPPEVDSAIITLKRKAARALPATEEVAFLRYVKSFFTNPRKQLKNVIAGIRGQSVDEVAERLQKLGLPVTVRAQELTEAEWISLFKEKL